MAKSSRTTVVITVIICTSLVLISAIGAWVYVQNQSIAQKDKELQQAKELKEKELQTQKDAAEIEAEGQRDAACRASGQSWFGC